MPEDCAVSLPVARCFLETFAHWETQSETCSILPSSAGGSESFVNGLQTVSQFEPRCQKYPDVNRESSRKRCVYLPHVGTRYRNVPLLNHLVPCKAYLIVLVFRSRNRSLTIHCKKISVRKNRFEKNMCKTISGKNTIL